MREITFQIPIRPTPKQSVKRGKHSFYQPKKLLTYEQQVARSAKDAMRSTELFSGPIEVEALFLYHYKDSQKKIKKTGHDWCLSYGDVDNLLKGLLDGMEGVVFKNDSHVCSAWSRKKVSYRDRILVTVRELVWS